MTDCPCGTGRTYDMCCGPLHDGRAEARTAVDLMRSRYTAFVMTDASYLLHSWHPAHRPKHVRFRPGQHWTSLDIDASDQGGMLDTVGVVELTARYTLDGEAHELHEASRFARFEGRWVYLDGS